MNEVGERKVLLEAQEDVPGADDVREKIRKRQEAEAKKKSDGDLERKKKEEEYRKGLIVKVDKQIKEFINNLSRLLREVGEEGGSPQKGASCVSWTILGDYHSTEGSEWNNIKERVFLLQSYKNLKLLCERKGYTLKSRTGTTGGRTSSGGGTGMHHELGTQVVILDVIF